ncbi:hypothetical protein NEOLEDRAFT_1063313 [Neolentinus lepideus HHB14362 ss-1]|uniref:Cryptic loci regulator 2 N-terminal domain-containing protein n=1 Tax=Neolentinus lepideus HHB14362 ss-1 TaxID=1314782 RepID=A0A165T8Z7_9AGAM|nr:hypothetical protein NEOLEDRAFT_1063313 [Neolentinus lepideus HHB14362 ss-1]
MGPSTSTGARRRPQAYNRTYEIKTYAHSELVEITLRRSDGDPSLWPSPEARTEQVDDQGQVDYYGEPTARESKLWRKKIGTFLARYPLRSDGQSLDPSLCYLKEFPDGYLLVTRISGNKNAPRRDCYLYGGQRRYDSPAEWCCHSKWLVEGCPMKSGGRKRDCECVVCDGTIPQKVLSQKYNLNDVDESSRSTLAKKKKSARRESKVDRPIMAKDYTKLNADATQIQMFPPQADHA